MLSFGSKFWLIILWSLTGLCPVYIQASPYFTLVSSALKGSRDSAQNLPGCYLGGQHYKFGERWSPVMEPTGLMVCLKCECLQVKKKGMVQTKGKTECRNIKDRCPDVTCSNPRTLPGRCCKICTPEDDFEATLSFRKVIPPLHPPEHLPSDDSQVYTGTSVYSSLLTSPTPGNYKKLQSDKTPGVTLTSSPVGDLRLTMNPEKGQLGFILRLSADLDPSSYLQLVDEDGEVQLQYSLRKKIRRDKRICGTLNEVPSVYKSYLDNGQLTARIASAEHPEGVISGEIIPDPKSQEDLLSGVLSPVKSDVTGGNAKVKYTPRTHTAVLKVTTKGLEFDVANKATFRLAFVHKSRTIFQSPQLTLSKFNQLEASWRMKRKRHGRLMARGKLRVRVLKAGVQPEILLEGALLSRLSCGEYQAVATGQDLAKISRPGSPMVTSAVLEVGDKGWLRFQVKVQAVPQTSVRRIILEGSRPSHKRHVIWKKSSRQKIFSTEDGENGDEVITGRFTKLDMDTLYRLRHNRMYVTVVLKNYGKVKAVLVSGGRNLASLNRQTNWLILPPSVSDQGRVDRVTAQLQLSMSPDCTLQFTALASASEVNRAKFNVHLSINGSDDIQSPKVDDEWWAAVNKPKVRRNYHLLEGQFVNLPNVSLLALDRGYAYLWITLRDLDKNPQVMATQKIQIRKSNQCWRHMDDKLNSDANSITPLLQQQQLRDEGGFEQQKDPTATQEQLGLNGVLGEAPPTCTFEGHVYQEGSAWLPDVNARCNTCSCVKGKVMCQRMICPELACSNPVQVDGECCPSCPVEASEETCQLDLDPRIYRLHSTWHPYLPSEGFSRCALCTCLPGGRSTCTKTECPALSCHWSRWVKSETDPCCHACAPVSDEVETRELPQQDIDMKGVCYDRGQLRRNGETWHPTIQTFGFMKCIQCLCTDGSFNCEFLKCPKLTCTKKRKIPNVCCEVCEDGSPNTVQNVTKPKKTVAQNKTRRKSKTKKKRKACKVNNRLYIHGEKWRPQTAEVYGNCAVCRCQNGKAKCRMRCPKTCETDRKSHRCCQYCDGKLTKDGTITYSKEPTSAKMNSHPTGNISHKSVIVEKLNLIKFLQS